MMHDILSKVRYLVIVKGSWICIIIFGTHPRSFIKSTENSSPGILMHYY